MQAIASPYSFFAASDYYATAKPIHRNVRGHIAGYGSEIKTLDGRGRSAAFKILQPV